MPPLQKWVMFASVVGPFLGFLLAVYLLWNRGPVAAGWREMVALVTAYLVTGFGVTIGFHRLMTHRAFETYRPLKIIFAICGSAAGQGMAIRWCATHRRHHQVADQHGDPHSPHLHGDGTWGLIKGMIYAHVMWCFEKDKKDIARSVPDLVADPLLLLVDQLYFLWVGLGILLPGIALGLLTHSWQGFLSGMAWGGLARIFLLQHVTWSVNSVCHVWGGRMFKSADHSTNNLPVAILSLGEGWHNNHHTFPTSARHGLKWYQFDSSWLIIWTLSKLGIFWNVRLPSETAMNARKV